MGVIFASPSDIYIYTHADTCLWDPSNGTVPALVWLLALLAGAETMAAIQR